MGLFWATHRICHRLKCYWLSDHWRDWCLWGKCFWAVWNVVSWHCWDWWHGQKYNFKIVYFRPCPQGLSYERLFPFLLPPNVYSRRDVLDICKLMLCNLNWINLAICSAKHVAVRALTITFLSKYVHFWSKTEWPDDKIPNPSPPQIVIHKPLPSWQLYYSMSRSFIPTVAMTSDGACTRAMQSEPGHKRVNTWEDWMKTRGCFQIYWPCEVWQRSQINTPASPNTVDNHNPAQGSFE